MKIQNIGPSKYPQKMPAFNANYIIYSKQIKRNLDESAIKTLKEIAIKRAIGGGCIRADDVGKRICINEGFIIVPDISTESGRTLVEAVDQYKKKADVSSITSTVQEHLSIAILGLLRDGKHVHRDYSTPFQ